MAKKITAYDMRRLARRDSIWPDSVEEIYNKANEAGFCTIPRTVSLVGTLIRHLSETKDPSRVYVDLWTRQRDDGFVDVEDPEELAQSAGYPIPPRNLRTWKEAIEELARLGFIKTSSKGTRKHKYVLLLHPHDVVEKMRAENPKAIPDWWWEVFVNRVQDIGAKLRGRHKGKGRAAKTAP
jgi:hypothetical protein